MQNTITYWILVLAGCILISSKCKASSCGSTCPGSVEPPEPSTRTEQYHVTAIKCQLVCVQKVSQKPFPNTIDYATVIFNSSGTVSHPFSI